MNKKEEINKIDNDSQENMSNSDTQYIISSDEEIISDVYHKFIDNKFLGCNVNDNGWSNNSQQSDSAIKRMKKRSTKKELYEKERNELIKELNEIIGINENNNSIFLYELEKNEKIKEYIKNNIKRIRKYHKTGTWGYFSNDLLKGKGKEIGLIRTLYIDNDYDILSKLKINNFDNIKKQYTQLIFYKE